MKLIYLESRKGILRCYVLIALALFLFLSGFKIYTDYLAGEIRPVAANVGGMQSGYSQIYKRVCGPITEKTAGFVSSEYQRLTALTADGTYSRDRQKGTYSGYLFGDFYLFHKYFYPAMEYSVKYSTYTKQILKQAKENLKLYQEKGNKAEVAKNAYILQHYTGRNIEEFYSCDGWEALLAYNFSDLLILLLLILGIAPSFTRERENGMTLLLYSSKRSEWPLLLSKCGTAVIFASVLTILFSLVNFLVFGILCGFEGGTSPLYAIESYKNTPYAGTILSFYILCTVLKAMGFSITGLVLILLSASFKKTLYPCLIGLGLGVLFCYASGWPVTTSWWHSLCYFLSPLTLTTGGELLISLRGICFREAFLPQLGILLVVQLILAGGLIFVIRRKSCY